MQPGRIVFAYMLIVVKRQFKQFVNCSVRACGFTVAKISIAQ